MILKTNEDLIKELTSYSWFKKEDELPCKFLVYRGINHRFYQKWVGFKSLEDGESEEVVDKQVVDFYMAYFFYPMKLDVLDNKFLQYMLLNFAVLNGKKKAISKLEKCLGVEITSTPSVNLMEVVNFFPKDKLIPKLILEFIEFYSYSKQLSRASWLLDTYRFYLTTR